MPVRGSARKLIARFAGLALLGVVFYFAVWPFVAGGERMQQFCKSLTMDASIAGVRADVEKQHYRMSGPDQDGRAYIHDTGSFGRFICAVEFRQARLVSAQYQRND